MRRERFNPCLVPAVSLEDLDRDDRLSGACLAILIELNDSRVVEHQLYR